MSKGFERDHLRILLDGETAQQTDQPTHYFTPGQLIKGTATYSPSSEVKVDVMTVVFKATLYIGLKDNGQASYGCVRTQNQNLFRYEKLIFQGPHKLSPRTHEWPFEFELPGSIKVPFATGPQAIPPTWDVLPSVRVIYSLRLSVNPNSRTRYMDIERPINVWPFQHIELPLPTYATQPLIDSTQTPGPKSALTRRRSSAVNTNTPNLNVSISIPSALGAWQNFSVQLLCNDTSDAEYTLNTCELALKAHATYGATETPTPTPPPRRPSNTEILRRISSTDIISRRRSNTETARRTSNAEAPAPAPKELFQICKFKLLGRGLQIPLDNTHITIKRDMRLIDMTRGDASILAPTFGISHFRLNYIMDVCVQMTDTKTGAVIERRGEVPLEILPGGLVEEGRGDDAPPAFHEVASPPGYDEGVGETGVWEGLFRSPAYTVTA